MDNFLFQIRNLDLDVEALYFLGILKACTEGSSVDTVEIIQNLFRNSAFELKLREIKELILQGQVQRVMEIMKRSQCNLCLKYSNELIKTPCGHFFHNDCLVRDITQNLATHCSYLCPACRVPIPNLQNLSQKIKALIRSHRITEILEDNPEITICPKCGNLCEVNSGPAYCHNCKTSFCEYCLQPCECLCDNN